MESAKGRAEKAEQHLQILNQTVMDKRKAHQSCMISFSADSANCIELNKSLEEARKESQSYYLGGYIDKLSRVDDAVEDHNLLFARFTTLQKRYSDAMEPLVDLQQRLTELNLRVFDLYREYVKLEGATGQIMWSLNWGGLLKEYQQKNRHMPVRWAQLPIKETEFLASIKGTNDSHDARHSRFNISHHTWL
jgi:hypothetical protein